MNIQKLDNWVEEIFQRRFVLWKRQCLSIGGRLTLIKSTLSSLSIYFMSMFLIPRRVGLRLKHIQRDFLWVGGAFDERPHLVNCSIAYLDKKHGGLSVRNLSTLNKAMLGKWSWDSQLRDSPYGNIPQESLDRGRGMHLRNVLGWL